MRSIIFLLASFLAFCLGSCSVVEGIFKAGMVWGIILVVGFIALIIFLIAESRRRKKIVRLMRIRTPTRRGLFICYNPGKSFQSFTHSRRIVDDIEYFPYWINLDFSNDFRRKHFK